MSKDPLQTEAQLAAVLESVGDGIITVDARQRVRFANSAAAEIFGRSREALMSGSVQELMPGRHRRRHDAAFRARLQARGKGLDTRAREVQGLRADGSVFPLEMRVTTTKVGRALFFTASLRDISRRKEAEAELERRSRESARLNRELTQERDYLREEVHGEFGDVVGRSAALKMLMSQVDAVAQTDAAVLITGESGAGKELTARAIHARSPRAPRALVRMDCASGPKAQFECELFGHAKGAFAAAPRARAGRLQLADRGTLFIDEIGELPLALQRKLLRVLEAQEFERVGEERSRRVDVRVVAATRRDLLAEIAAGRFREDLYYRLGVFHLRVPPLRERLDDLMPLATHFLARAAAKLQRAPAKLSPRSEAAMREYGWPGNVRELHSVMERASILARGTRVEPEMLGLPLLAPATAGRRPSSGRKRPRGPGEAEILAALQAHGGVVARAARALGLSRQALYRRMTKFGIE